MITKNACDVLGAIAAQNLLQKDASAIGRIGGKLLKNLPFYRNMLKGFGRQVGNTVKAVGTDARAVGRLGQRVARHGVDAAVDATKRGAKAVKDAAVNTFNNPAVQAAGDAVVRGGKGAAKQIAPGVAAAAAYKWLTDQD